METTKTKKKVNIDGKQQKVDHNVYLVLQNLTEALKQHEIALMTWVHKVYNEKKKHNEEEKMLHDYCMQIPDAAGILTRMKTQTKAFSQELAVILSSYCVVYQ